MSEENQQAGAATPAPEAPEVQRAPVEGVDVNIPLTDAQKLLVVRVQNKKLSIEKQIADLQSQAAKVDAFFHGQLVKIGQDNKIDMTKFVLSEDLEIKPMPPQAQQGQQRR
jgi:adenine deaminase